MTRIIIDKKQIERLNKKFKEKIEKYFREKIPCKLGYQGGNKDVEVNYSDNLGIWACFQYEDNRYWNAFGIGKPELKKSNSITVEINFSYEKINRRIQGIFVQENNGNILVLHRGRINGIKRELFDGAFKGTSKNVMDGDKETKFYLVGELESKDFPEQLAKFVEKINILKYKELLDNDDIDEQEKIQNTEPATQEEIEDSVNKPLCIVKNGLNEAIGKKSNISKSALKKADYTCQIDPTHKTFITTRGEKYMEGHHLIPCTVKNSKYFEKKFKKNIDCFENIVCICPNCHRAVHFGDWNTKEEMIKMMFIKQSGKLKKVGILITEKELLNLYRTDRE